MRVPLKPPEQFLALAHLVRPHALILPLQRQHVESASLVLMRIGRAKSEELVRHVQYLLPDGIKPAEIAGEERFLSPLILGILVQGHIGLELLKQPVRTSNPQ